MKRDYNLEKRKYVLGGAVVVVVFVYLIRLFTLQLMSEDYKKNADSNAFLNKTRYPSRGVIYDRNGELLVYNQPAYDVTMVMKEVEDLDTPTRSRSTTSGRTPFPPPTGSSCTGGSGPRPAKSCG